MRFSAILLFVAVVAIAGCASSVEQNPIALPNPPAHGSAVETNRYLWGIWDVYVAADRGRAEVSLLRTADLHLNAVRLLEVTPCSTCLTISGVHATGPDEFEADVTLTHPYPALIKYTAFDVRGIFISQADFTFPASGRKVALGNDVPRMLDPDGYTALFNPTEFPPSTPPTPPALGYIAGKYSSGGSAGEYLTSTLNPFVAYRKDAPRRMFEVGGSETKTVRIHAPAGPLRFGYAVDVCWQLVNNVVDPLKDFPPDANCLEAYRISVEMQGEIAAEVGGEAPIEVRVWDHQGYDTIESVTIEAPDLFEGELPLSFSTVMPDESCLFTGTVPNYVGAPEGDYFLLVRVTDKAEDQNLGPVDAWQLSHAIVGPAHGWARTWGGVEDDTGFGVAVDKWGHVYVVGGFHDTVDFDPGPGEDCRQSNGDWDSFLIKLNPAGDLEWIRTWGGTGYEIGWTVVVNSWGDVCVAGEFAGTVDFDPGPSEDSHSSNGETDVFLSKFDPNGCFLWARTWGGAGHDHARDLAVDSSGNVLITGCFWFTVDFDPGAGVEEHAANGGNDVYLSKFTENGTFQWTRTWGSEEGYDEGWGVATDPLGNVYVSGQFKGSADFDPGDGTDIHSSNAGGIDVFLSKFDASGTFVWARNWGNGIGHDVAVVDSGHLFVTGRTWGVVDFDPSSGEDIHSSNWPAVFLSKFDTTGNYLWARTWGGIFGLWDDTGWGVTTDDLGNAYVAGFFNGSSDFDPGPDSDIHSSNGYIDAFLSKFSSNGGFLWARTWGGPEVETAYGVAFGSPQGVYVTGCFGDQVDFDPGPQVDKHYSNGSGDAFVSKFLADGSW